MDQIARSQNQRSAHKLGKISLGEVPVHSLSLVKAASFLIWLTLITRLNAVPVSAPYAMDFSQFPAGQTTIPNLTISGAAPWAISNDGRYITTVNAPRDVNYPGWGSATLQITNLASQDFEISTRFSRSTNYPGTVSLGAFSDSPDLMLGSKYLLSVSDGFF